MSGMKFEWRGGEYFDRVKANAGNAMVRIGEDLAAKSAGEAPFASGDLEGDCVASYDGNGRLSVGYSLPYALIQHENLSFSHPRGGKAKFLEDPFNANAARYVEMVGEAVKRGMGG